MGLKGVIVKVFDSLIGDVEQELDMGKVQRDYSVKGRKILFKLVDKHKNPLWQKGFSGRGGRILEIPNLTNKTADCVAWMRPGICFALLKGRIKRMDGNFWDYDLRDAILSKDVKVWAKYPVAADIKTLEMIWNDYRDQLALVMIRKDIYTAKDFNPEIIERLKEKGLLRS